jgi:hypothetical protein
MTLVKMVGRSFKFYPKNNKLFSRSFVFYTFVIHNNTNNIYGETKRCNSQQWYKTKVLP